jgi:biofilm PGA synthesis N-glycosyltransferase PgaC
MTLFCQILFWSCVAGLTYLYVGYPAAIWALSRRARTTMEKSDTPLQVSVVIVAYNEAARLARKLDNLLSLVGEERIVEIIVGSDGSTDDSAEVVRRCPDSRVTFVPFPLRRGKPAVLNDLIPQCRGDVILLSDCRQVFDSMLLARLLENFADPRVGVVSGELVLCSSPEETTAAHGIGLYWKYEKFIRKCESRYRGVPGATGACYAIRRSHFKPIQEQIILDDVAIPMQATIQGYRCLLEPAAIAYDEPSKSPRQEAIRKRRTIAGAAQLVRVYPEWLNPRRNPIWFEYVSHKVLRLASPALLAGAVVSNAWLLETSMYRVLFLLQGTLYLAAIAGGICQTCGRRSVLFGPPLMFVALNVTTVLALWDALRSKYQVTWRRSQDWDTPPSTISVPQSQHAVPISA